MRGHAALGIDPVQFGVIFVLNLMIGTVTPPVGVVLYVTAKVADVSFERMSRAVLPYLGLLRAVLVLITVAVVDVVVARVAAGEVNFGRSNASDSPMFQVLDGASDVGELVQAEGSCAERPENGRLVALQRHAGGGLHGQLDSVPQTAARTRSILSLGGALQIRHP